MSTTLRWLGPLLCILCLTLSTHAAHADDALDAHFFDARGRQLYAQGSFDAALRAFLRAHTIAPSLATEYNVALTADLAGEPLLAWNAFERFLREAPEDHRLRGEAQQRQTRLGRSVHVVDISTVPAQAEVFVDRMEHGRGGRTPLRLALTPGAHQLLVLAERHEPVTRSVDGGAGVLTRVHVDLRARLGTLALSRLPRGGVLTLERDDGVVVESASDEPLSLLVGTYRATLAATGFQRTSVHVEIRDGETQPLVLTPIPVDGPTGRLVVRVNPDATLLVDGTERAQAPIVLHRVGAGPHRIELRAPGFRPWAEQVDIRANEATHLDVTLVPAPPPAPR
jgi:hypothetical protein